MSHVRYPQATMAPPIHFLKKIDNVALYFLLQSFYNFVKICVPFFSHYFSNHEFSQELNASVPRQKPARFRV